jgi:hypothetical protein
VFVNDGASWQQQGKIKANSAMMNQQLGSTVSVSGDTIVAAAPGELIANPPMTSITCSVKAPSIFLSEPEQAGTIKSVSSKEIEIELAVLRYERQSTATRSSSAILHMTRALASHRRRLRL